MNLEPKLRAALTATLLAAAPNPGSFSAAANEPGPESRAPIDALLARTRQATGWPVRDDRHELVVRGRVHHPGAEGTFVWRFGAGGRYLRSSNAGPLDRSTGCDGGAPWIEDAPGRVRSLELGDADGARLLSRVLSGDWLDPRTASAIESVPIDAAAGGSADTASASGSPNTAGAESMRTVAIRIGARRSTLQIDPASAEPRRLVLDPSYGRQSWTFASFKTFGSTTYPAVIENQLPAGLVIRYDVESVVLEPVSTTAIYGMPRTGGSRLDPSISPELKVERTTNGFLLVNPMIDGRDAGWFIFDTGAGANVITPQAADSLGLRTVGQSWLGLAAGATSGTLRRSDSLRLGPLTIERPVWVEMDLAAISAVSGRTIAGIIGYDVLMRAVVEIEVAAPRIAIGPRAPDSDQAPRWEPIVLYGNHVYVTGRFEGHEGLFRLDTGAPQVPVIFNGPAVKRLDLLASRETKEAEIGVPGGAMKVAIGPVERLEIGGHRFDELTAIFPLGEGGAFDDRYTIANLGQECLHPFRVFFDYPNHRAAFIETAAPQTSGTVGR